jgi:hypothetical protein
VRTVQALLTGLSARLPEPEGRRHAVFLNDELQLVVIVQDVVGWQQVLLAEEDLDKCAHALVSQIVDLVVRTQRSTDQH